MDTIKLYLILLSSFIGIVQVFSQEKSVQIPLTESRYFNENKGNTVDILSSTDVWSKDGATDSILWPIDITILDEKSKSHNIRKKLYVVTRKIHSDSVSVEISRRRNPFINKDVQLRFHADSLKKWRLKTVPSNILEKVKFAFNFIDEKTGSHYSLPWEAYFIPFSVGMTYNDARLNEMPLAVKIGFNRMGKFGEDIIYVSKRMTFNKPEFRIYRDGKNPHEDKFVNNIRYKEKYNIRDTVAINAKIMRIDSLDESFSVIYLTPVGNYISDQYISPSLKKELSQYFKPSSKYLVLDFWGTWCVPCISAMPKTKLIVEELKSTASFVGVCFDMQDKFDLAKTILNEKGVNWPQLYVDMNQKTNSIVFELGVSIFPTYIVIDRDGKIIFRDSSEGLARIKDIVLK
ncbi:MULTISPECIES: TlpA family protein disulfide reductase [Sphingobacterium]|uniref:TlpA family protein disulfide reductase n=1 Tax=Sphingobacterium TaxID=28453 RepID=UPI00257B0B7E|nr:MULTISPECIES: TlpA disulfide reductase family protein [Sphingobacterium]